MGIDWRKRRFQRAPSVSGPSAPFHSHFPPTGSGWCRFFPRSVCAFGCTLAVAGLGCSAQGTGHPRKKNNPSCPILDVLLYFVKFKFLTLAPSENPGVVLQGTWIWVSNWRHGNCDETKTAVLPSLNLRRT
jgi:hypothetical protein